MFKIPKYPNLTELAYLHIKRDILEGSFSEGTKLTEDTLAAQLGISKSPVREALNRLESEGLVSIEPRRGAYVRRFTLQEACDLFGLREVLEVHAVGLARITPSLLKDLVDSIKRIKAVRCNRDRGVLSVCVTRVNPRRSHRRRPDRPLRWSQCSILQLQDSRAGHRGRRECARAWLAGRVHGFLLSAPGRFCRGSPENPQPPADKFSIGTGQSSG